MKKLTILFLVMVIILSSYVLLGSAKAYVGNGDNDQRDNKDRIIQEAEDEKEGNKIDRSNLTKDLEDPDKELEEDKDDVEDDEMGEDVNWENGRYKNPKGYNLGELMRDKKLSKSERLELIADFKGKTKAEKCEVIKNGIDKRIARYEHNYQYHEEKYNDMIDKTNDLLDRLDKDSKVDTSSVRAKLVVVDQYVREIESQKEELIRTMEQARNYGCEDNEEGSEFRKTLSESKSQLVSIRNSIKELHSFIKDDLKTELLNLRDDVNSANRNKLGEIPDYPAN